MSHHSRFSIHRLAGLRLGVVFVPLLAAQLFALPAAAGERIALVIGNGAYEHVAPLDHVESDMAVMADTLRSLDFDVEAAADLDRSAMAARIADFGRRIDLAGGDSIGLLFYAGHGFRRDGSNYLLPVDAEIADADDVDDAAIDLDLTLAELAFATNEHKLVILDVPADSVIAEEAGLSPGLAAIDAPVGTLVAFGASPAPAAGRPRHHGLYPLALANGLSRPGLMVEQVFQEVRLDVAEATDGVQIPWESSSLTAPIYLAGPPLPAENAAPSGPVAIDPRTADLVAWTAIRDSGDPDAFAGYLNDFADGMFRSLAEHRLADLADADMAVAEEAETPLPIEKHDERLITQKRANVRAEPSAAGVIVATLEPNRPVLVIGEVSDDDWLQVALGEDIEAFMWAPLLAASPPSDLDIDLAAIQPPSKSALLGRWQGEYQCQWDTIGFTLDIADHDSPEDETIVAVFSFYALPGSPSLPSGSFAMTGAYHADDGTILLKSGDWIERPSGLQRHDLAGRAEIGGAEILGRIETPGCSDFHLARGEGPQQSAVHSVATQ